MEFAILRCGVAILRAALLRSVYSVISERFRADKTGVRSCCRDDAAAGIEKMLEGNEESFKSRYQCVPLEGEREMRCYLYGKEMFR
jgi:hypothetical protein